MRNVLTVSLGIVFATALLPIQNAFAIEMVSFFYDPAEDSVCSIDLSSADLDGLLQTLGCSTDDSHMAEAKKEVSRALSFEEAFSNWSEGRQLKFRGIGPMKSDNPPACYPKKSEG